MSLSTRVFTWSPSPDYSVPVEEKVDEISFGDGYQCVIPSGLNFARRSWPLSFGGPASRANEIEDFLKDHAGGRSFLWVVPESGEQIRVRAKPGSRARRVVSQQVSVISVTFVEAFE